ncbi:MAG: nucleotidyl transferase AbiEii/AbiGii toxin family protein [Syntrophus sp. (in: bacteria)]|nr:nucleotidyl transferase AbiEii/AbiGii toxin family protein [Syntrophus sp. (in: bacteria)]
MIVCRALVEIFSHPDLAKNLAFRGGTALFKLHLPQARYSEDIDLVQVHPGPIGPVMDALQERLNNWLGKPKRSQSQGRVTFLYRMQSERGTPLRLKVEINSREHFSVFGLEERLLRVDSRWFSGSASVLTYHIDELLGTKVRALYQRKKGRDLFDLWKAFNITNASPDRVIECFLRYMEYEGRRVSRAEFEENLLLKLEDPRFLNDIGPLLAPDCACDIISAADCVLNRLAVLIPGEPWEGRGEKKKKQGKAKS